jgi:hypothetical protein
MVSQQRLAVLECIGVFNNDSVFGFWCEFDYCDMMFSLLFSVLGMCFFFVFERLIQVGYVELCSDFVTVFSCACENTDKYTCTCIHIYIQHTAWKILVLFAPSFSFLL